MAYQALYRKYRPSTFDDFIDQDNVKKILVNSIKNNKISHAYLFAGPRGIGKTSMAKIFAKAINCDNFNKKSDVCDKCDNCVEANNNSVDIIEIDAASNNGVDQIRDLKNKISIVPSVLKYKVYIIDEVHMLTNTAFNALLKTLEEPPSYVVFILATTEFYEVPETIVSRCQCFNFNRISLESMEKRLKYIAKNEKIDITDEAITEIAHYANGGLRDAIGMLDKLNSFTNEKITIDTFKCINGMISQEDINNFYDYIFDNDASNILETINMISEQGYDFKNFVERVMILTRDKIVDYYLNKKDIKGTIDKNVELITVLNDILNRLKEAINPIVIVQIYLLKFINEESNISREMIESKPKNVENEPTFVENINEENISREIILEDKPKKNSKKEANNDKVVTLVVNEKNKRIRINNAMATANLDYKKDLIKLWENIDKYFMDDKYGKIAQLLSDTVPMVVGTKYMILTTVSDGIINNIYDNLDAVEKFISSIYKESSVVLLLDSEFELVKNKYIEDRNNKIIYQEQEECGKLIEESYDLASQAISLFGKDIVDIE